MQEIRFWVLTQVTCASLVKECNVLGNDRLIKVSSKIPCYALTKNVEDGSAHSNTNSRNLQNRVA